MNHEQLGQRVRQLRLARGLSQDALAQRVQVSRQTVFDIERGRTRTPQGETLLSLADALGVTEVYLLTGHDEPPSDSAWPPLDVALRHVTCLDESDITMIVRIVRALESADHLSAAAASAGPTN